MRAIVFCFIPSTSFFEVRNIGLRRKPDFPLRVRDHVTT